MKSTKKRVHTVRLEGPVMITVLGTDEWAAKDPEDYSVSRDQMLLVVDGKGRYKDTQLDAYPREEEAAPPEQRARLPTEVVKRLTNPNCYERAAPGDFYAALTAHHAASGEWLRGHLDRAIRYAMATESDRRSWVVYVPGKYDKDTCYHQHQSVMMEVAQQWNLPAMFTVSLSGKKTGFYQKLPPPGSDEPVPELEPGDIWSTIYVELAGKPEGAVGGTV